jgi:hypothetical protein
MQGRRSLGVAWLSHPDGTRDEIVQEWSRRSTRHGIVPDIINPAAPELEKGMPFIQLVFELTVDHGRDAAVLCARANGSFGGSSDIYLVVPSGCILHPTTHSVEVVDRSTQ